MNESHHCNQIVGKNTIIFCSAKYLLVFFMSIGKNIASEGKKMVI